jgi:hypothetical protein
MQLSHRSCRQETGESLHFSRTTKANLHDQRTVLASS